MITAIETTYAGRRFRSRREARWAVLFDQLDLDWRYEPEGYVLPGNVQYLPDFELHLPGGQRLWVEVKAEVEPNSKLSALVDESEQEGYLVGEPMLRASVLRRRPGGGWLEMSPVTWLKPLCGRDELSIQAASNAALSARWEHGERPRRPAREGGRPPRVYQRAERLMDEVGGISSGFGAF
jgi:hypothetical protein